MRVRARVHVPAKWVRRGHLALAATTKPEQGEKVTYHSVVWVEAGQAAVMSVMQNAMAEMLVACLKQLRAKRGRPRMVI